MPHRDLSPVIAQGCVISSNNWLDKSDAIDGNSSTFAVRNLIFGNLPGCNRYLITLTATSESEMFYAITVDWEITAAVVGGSPDPFMAIDTRYSLSPDLSFLEIGRFSSDGGAKARKTETLIIPAGLTNGFSNRMTGKQSYHVRTRIENGHASLNSITGRIYEVTVVVVSRHTQANIEG